MPGTLDARWNYANAYSGHGLATGGPGSGAFAGRYHVRYFLETGEFSDEYDLDIKKRIDDYQVKTEPMITFFKRINILHSVDATKSIPEVFEEIRTSLGLPLQPKPMNSNALSTEAS